MLSLIKTNVNPLQLLSDESKIKVIIESIFQEISERLILGKPLLVFGPALSAADILHIYSELKRKFNKDRQALNLSCSKAIQL